MPLRTTTFRAAALAAILALLSGCASTPEAQVPAPSSASPAETTTAAQQDGKQRFRSLVEAIRASGVLAGRPGPASMNWIDEGDRFSYTMRDPQTGRTEVRLYEPSTLSDQMLFDNRQLTLPGTGRPLEYRSFQWADDSRHLLFQTDFRPIYRNTGISDYYLYSLDEGTLELVADDARTAELAPDGSLMGYERGGDLFVYDPDTGTETRLTTSGSDTIFNGVFDWVYEEEFGLGKAWEWSRDSRHIAFWQTDERGVPSIAITDWSGLRPDFTRIPIPKAGDPNPTVRIGVADVETGDVVFLDTGLGEHYVPRIYWTSEPGTLAVVTLNRLQNHVRLFFFDVATGEGRQVFEETSDTWIDVFDFFAGIDHFFYFPEGTDDILWVGDRDGHQHLYRYGYDGALRNQVTSGDWNVTRVEAVDASRRTIYYTSAEVSPLERHLYAIGFDGTGKRRLSRVAGRHSFDVGPNARYYIDRHSSTDRHRTVELWNTDGERLAVLEDNADTDRWLQEHAYSSAQLFSFTTSDGVTLDGSMIRPPDFDSTRAHPLVVSIYGGPGAQQVYDAFATNGFQQWLAQQGYVVVGLNNRGSGNYGRDFMKQVYRRLGYWESNDFVEVARWLARKPWIDGEHMAIMGTSYGGYSTIYTMLAHPGVFRLGIANSPVTDWRIYDSIYTERYMGLPADNAEGYEGSAAMPKAGNLDGHLLVVHAGMDENVQPRHTFQLLTALTDAGKDAEVRFYPPGAHGAAYSGPSYILLQRVYEATLCEHLKAGCELGLLNR